MEKQWQHTDDRGLAILNNNKAMEKMKTFLIALLGAIMMLFSLSSCSSDKEDVEFEYESGITVSAAHIFDSFQSVMDDDFKLDGTCGKWNLNLHLFIYDVDGNLIDKAEDSYTSLTSTLNHKVSVKPGKYTIVSIAEFDGTYEDAKIKFWNISNEQHLSSLMIQESESILSSAMETLGIDVETIEVSNNTVNVNIDIKPVTGLVEMIIWDDDFSSAGKNGYSSYAPLINDLTILSQQLKQIVKFEDGNVTYDYGIQAVRYPMTTHSPRIEAANGRAKQALSYRALLPDNDKRFYWECHTIPGAGKGIFDNHEDFQTSALTDNSVNIESGKQYVMDLLLDMLYLYVDEYDPHVDMFTRIEKYMGGHNNSMILEALGNRYDKLVGFSKEKIESYLKIEESNVSGDTVNYLDSRYLFFKSISVVFEDETFEKSKQIILTWNNGSKGLYDTVAECLAAIYTPWEKGTTATVKQYINAKTIEEATVIMSWNSNDYRLYFDPIQH